MCQSNELWLTLADAVRGGGARASKTSKERTVMHHANLNAMRGESSPEHCIERGQEQARPPKRDLSFTVLT